MFQDIGGEERPVSDEHLRNCDFISPNLTELRRLVRMPVGSEQEIVAAARALQRRGASNVLVTLGHQGSLLLTADGEVLRQPAVPVDCVVDETGAGE